MQRLPITTPDRKRILPRSHPPRVPRQSGTARSLIKQPLRLFHLRKLEDRLCDTLFQRSQRHRQQFAEEVWTREDVEGGAKDEGVVHNAVLAGFRVVECDWVFAYLGEKIEVACVDGLGAVFVDEAGRRSCIYTGLPKVEQGRIGILQVVRPRG